MGAVYHGNEIAVRLLLEKGALTDYKSLGGLSAISLARDGGNQAIIELLESYRNSS